MSTALQLKLDRYTARYPDGGVPMDARHVLELCTDLHDLISSLMGRVAQLEQDMALRPRPEPLYRDPRGT